MGSIYAFGSQESLRQDVYLTQGINETYGAFSCRVAGLKIKFEEPDRLLRRMSGELYSIPQGSFKTHFSGASVSPEYSSSPGDEVAAAQRYYIHLRSDTLKKSSARDNSRAAQAINEQSKIQRHVREMGGGTQKKTVLQRLLNFLTRCFMPCINVKK